MITRVNSRIFQIHSLYDLRDFPENGHSDNDYFREKIQKSYIGRHTQVNTKIPKIHPSRGRSVSNFQRS